MKIWIDFINTPQVSFWLPFIKSLKKENYEFMLTCRNSGNTISLLRLNKLDYKIIGKKAGSGKIHKLLLFIIRLLKLSFYIIKNRPDIAASQSSFYQPIVCKLLGIPCLYTNDNEHARGNIFGFRYATIVILPKVFKNDSITNRNFLKSKLLFYNSVKEAIYLSQKKNYFSLYNNTPDIIFFRPEPSSAQYYRGPLNFFDDILIRLSTKYKIIVLPRDKNQSIHYEQKKFSTLTVANQPLPLEYIVTNCKLFIGAGGSMTRELAVLGIPVISIYQDKILKVDEYLVKKGCMTINPGISYFEILSILNEPIKKQKDLSVLTEGIESFQTIKNIITHLKQ